jgi:hypothetical protein
LSGADGITIAVTAFEFAEEALAPASLIAVTVNV